MSASIDPVGNALRQSLDALSRSQEVRTHNLANVDTPGYKAKQVVFRSELDSAMAGVRQNATHRNHLQSEAVASGPQVVEAPGAAYRNDGNTVDVERELAGLAETNITYAALSRQVSARLALLRTVITEGRL